jgi:hypothetical protein
MAAGLAMHALQQPGQPKRKGSGDVSGSRESDNV